MSTYARSLAGRAYAQRQDAPIAAALTAHGRALPRDAAHLERELEQRPELQDQLAALINYSPSVWLVERELEEIDVRRKALNLGAVDVTESDPLARAYKSNVIGLACSGGGIRSASFNLGLLQGLAGLGLLRHIDYLSSVSGGGYIHQWLAAWLRRSSPERAGTAATALAAFDQVEARLQPAEDSARGDEAPQIRWLRRYSNYLTPKQGFFTADTWVGMATWTRNTLLNQVTLIAGLFVLLLVPHLLAPPAGVVVNSAPPMPGETRIITIAVAVLLVVLLAIVAVLASANLSEKYAKSSAARLLDDAGVQLFLIVPLVAWALLVTLLQEVMGTLANPTLLLVLAGGAGMTLMGAALAFRGGALTAYKQNVGLQSLALKRATVPVAGVLVAVVVAAVLGCAWTILVPPLVAELLASLVPVHETRLRMIVGPPLVMLGPIIGVVVLVGLLGRMYQEQRREWLSRLTAWGGMYAALWTAYVGLAYAAHPTIDWLVAHASAGVPSLLTWAGMTAAGVLAGNGAQTAGSDTSASKPVVAREWLAAVAPYVFAIGLLLLVGWAAERAFVATGHFTGFVILFLVASIICVLFAWRVDVNAFSMHAFYRNRLARCYLAASNPAWNPNPFIAIDPQDTKVPLSALRASTHYPGPYPVFCAALNLSGGNDLAWQERKAASFVFTPLYSGYDVPWDKRAAASGRLRPSGYVQTEHFAYGQPGIHIGTVAAISGAAASPNRGYHTNPVTAFLMTVFNVRLGWWILNPRVVSEDGFMPGSTTRPRPTPEFALSELVKELLGSVDDTRRYVYLTDGGHFDNTGLYELVRRRCRFIIVSDAEEDGDMKFDGISMAIRKCRADFGVEIDLDLRTLDRRESTGLSDRHVVIGTVKYPGIDGKGTLVYLKSSLTGDEPADLLGYHRANGKFPHQSTADQWFNESQFESYRRLGRHIVDTTFGAVARQGANYADAAVRQDFFRTLFAIWHPPTPEMERFHTAHAERYSALQSHIRTDERLDGLLQTLYTPGLGDWKTGKTPEDVSYAVSFTSELLEFMATVYTDLNLISPKNAAHPYSQGWIGLFAKCAQVDVIQDGWRQFGPSYSAQFRHFAVHNVGLPVLPNPVGVP